jgi:hypothetical protein
VAHGRAPDAAAEWVDSVDEPNARRIALTKTAASAVVFIN